MPLGPDKTQQRQSIVQGTFAGLLGRLIILAVVLLIIGQGAIALIALSRFERELEPELQRKATVIGTSVAKQIAYAVGLGIPKNRLVGMDDFFASILSDTPILEYLIMVDPDGMPLFHRGADEKVLDAFRSAITDDMPREESAVSQPFQHILDYYIDRQTPIIVGGTYVGALHVGIARNAIRGQLLGVRYDFLVVLGVSLLIAIELLITFVSVQLGGRLRWLDRVLLDGSKGDFTQRYSSNARDEIDRLVQAINGAIRRVNIRADDVIAYTTDVRRMQIDPDKTHRIAAVISKLVGNFRFAEPDRQSKQFFANAMQIRIPLFLFMFSEELSRSFLPLYVGGLQDATLGLSKAMAMGLPITVFMLVVTLMTPIAGSLADRYGPRRTFLLGIVPAVIGYVGACFPVGLLDFLLWRGISAIGYGLIFLSSQAWIAQHSDSGNRNSSASIFVGAVLAASVCGPSIGALLSDRIGYGNTFLVSAVLALLSGLVVYAMLGSASVTRHTHRSWSPTMWLPLLRDGEFITLTLCAAVPAKMMLSGFLFFLVPLSLNALGSSQPEIGRVMMLYGLLAVVFTPIVARMNDRMGNTAAAVLIGGLAASVGAMSTLLSGSMWLVVAAVGALGFGHACSLSAQLAQVQNIAARLDSVMGQATVIGAYRFVERGGTVLGPLIAASLVDTFGFRAAMSGMGLIGLCGILIYGAHLLIDHRRTATVGVHG